MKIIAVDIGGTKIDFGVVLDNRLIRVRTEATEADKGVNHVLRKIIDNIALLMEKDTNGIALAVPGPIDYKKGTVIFTPNMKGWKDIRLKEIIQKRFRIDTKLDNDAHCFLLGHYRYGNIVGITLGTGIGSAFSMEGKIYHGEKSATELGHMTIVANGRICGCGNKGCFEAYCSGTAIEKRYLELAKTSKTAKEIAEMKDKQSKIVLNETAHYLAVGLNNIKNIFDPEVIILGGSISKISFVIKKAVSEMQKMPFKSKTKVEVSTLNYPNLLGAAKLFES